MVVSVQILLKKDLSLPVVLEVVDVFEHEGVPQAFGDHKQIVVIWAAENGGETFKSELLRVIKREEAVFESKRAERLDHHSLVREIVDFCQYFGRLLAELLTPVFISQHVFYGQPAYEIDDVAEDALALP